MGFLGHRDDDRAARAPQEIDLAAGEWDEVDVALPAADERHLGVGTILSFWAVAAMLLLVIVAAPALEAVAHRFH